MAQAVSRRPLTAETRVRSRDNPCGIFGGRSGTGTGFPRVLRFSPVNFIPPVLENKQKRKKKKIPTIVKFIVANITYESSTRTHSFEHMFIL
jgi:hypothetical protein